MGRLLENAVSLELRRRLRPQQDIHYWKNLEGVEADFVVREGPHAQEIIQASHSIENEKTKKREIKGLVSCAREFGLKSGSVITWSAEGVETVDGVTVDRSVAKRITTFLRERLASVPDPRALGKPLRGPLRQYWRYRVGDYRLICDIQDQVLRILVIDIGDRKDIYGNG